MPFTKEFIRIRNRLRCQYKDVARADTFAFKKAIEEKIPTWKERDKKFKKQKTKNDIYKI